MLGLHQHYSRIIRGLSYRLLSSLSLLVLSGEELRRWEVIPCPNSHRHKQTSSLFSREISAIQPSSASSSGCAHITKETQPQRLSLTSAAQRSSETCAANQWGVRCYQWTLNTHRFQGNTPLLWLCGWIYDKFTPTLTQAADLNHWYAAQLL